MQKLHLVGFTTEHDGLILSARKSARSGGYLLQVDKGLLEAVEAYRAHQADQGPDEGAARDRVQSRLSVGEVQARLRRGKSVKDVAKEAGVTPEWVERFAAPVFAERAQIIDFVRTSALRRPRLGPSAHPIGEALRRNLAERGVALSVQEFAEAWSAHQLPNGTWTVRFKVRYRGADKTLRFDLRGVGREITADEPLTKQLAYVAPPVKAKAPVAAPVAAPVELAVAPTEDEPKKRAQVSTGFRPVPAGKATSRPAKEREKAAKAMTKAAAKRAVEGERAAARRAKEKAQAQARAEREAQQAAQRKAKEAAARARAAAAAARAAAAEAAKREQAEAAAAAKKAAERERARAKAKTAAEQQAKARVAAKKATAKAATTTAAGARKAAPAKASGATTAGSAVATTPAARRRAAAAETARRDPAATPRTPSPATTAKRAAADRPAASPTRRPAEGSPTRRPASGSPTRRPVAEPPPTPAARVDPTRLGPPGSYGPEASRALFRAGLAEPAADQAGPPTRPVPAVPADAAEDRPEVRLLGRRRRRQLRAD